MHESGRFKETQIKWRFVSEAKRETYNIKQNELMNERRRTYNFMDNYSRQTDMTPSLEPFIRTPQTNEPLVRFPSSPESKLPSFQVPKTFASIIWSIICSKKTFLPENFSSSVAAVQNSIFARLRTTFLVSQACVERL